MPKPAHKHNCKNIIFILIYDLDCQHLFRVLHLAIIHNHQDVVLQLLDVLPQLPPTETPVVDCLNNFKQVSNNCVLEYLCCLFKTVQYCVHYRSAYNYENIVLVLMYIPAYMCLCSVSVCGLES